MGSFFFSFSFFVFFVLSLRSILSVALFGLMKKFNLLRKTCCFFYFFHT